MLFQCPTVSGVSQPSSNLAREIRISQWPQSYLVLFMYSWQKWRGSPTSGGETGPTVLNKVQITLLPAFL